MDRLKARASNMGPRSFRGRLFAGVLLIIPLAVTAFLMNFVYSVLLAFGAAIVNSLSWSFMKIFGGDEATRLKIDPANPTWPEITMAVGLTILLLYLLGWLGSNVVGQRLIEAIENLFERIPMVDKIYGAMKKMVHAMTGDTADKKQRVVLVDFPHENMKALGFLTNIITDRETGAQLATVYLPTTPNPTSGYMEVVPLDRVTNTDWTVDEAISIILSGGATAPPTVSFDPPIYWSPRPHRAAAMPPRPRDTEP